MTNHILTADEVETAAEAWAAARAHRVAAAGIARREAATRGDLAAPTRRQLVTDGPGLAPVIPPATFDPFTGRGQAPAQPGNRRTWNIHHGAADSLVERARQLEAEEANMNRPTTPAPNSELESAMARLADLEEQLQIRQAANAADARAATTRGTVDVRVGAEPSVYRADHARAGQVSYLTDLYRGQVLGDPQANERLARHGREVEARGLTARATSTASVAGFVPPAYLVELFADLARAGRPTANLVSSLPLPEEGMSLSIPRLTTGTAVGAQATENAEVTNQDPDDTVLPVPVRTVAGFVDVSRQAVERGQLVEAMVFADLAAAYNSELNRQVLAGSGTGGEHAGILNTPGVNAVTYTDAAPTLPALWPKLAAAVGRVISQRFTGPTAIILSPATWAWLLASLDDSNRPLMAPTATGPANAMGVTAEPGYDGSAGSIMGVKVYLDGTMPSNLGTGTNESRIVVADLRDSFLWEDPAANPAQIRFDGVGSGTLTVRLSAHGYSAFTAGRQPTAVSVVGGTGLVTPSL